MIKRTNRFAVVLACCLIAVLGGCSQGSETSLEFDAAKMRVLFEAIRPGITSGFGEQQIVEIERGFSSLKVDGTKELTFPVVYAGAESELRIRIRKEDVDAVEMHFFGTPALVAKIQDMIRTTPLDAN